MPMSNEGKSENGTVKVAKHKVGHAAFYVPPLFANYAGY